MTLAFGEPDSNARVDVTVFAKLPGRDLGGGMSVGPTHLGEVASFGLLGLHERAVEALVAETGMRHQRAARQVDDEETENFGFFDGLESPLWRPGELLVDDEVLSAQVAVLRDAWTICADLGAVFADVSGSGGVPDRLQLTTVRSLERFPVPRWDGDVDVDTDW